MKNCRIAGHTPGQALWRSGGAAAGGGDARSLGASKSLPRRQGVCAGLESSHG
jgi:hypothetical protein